MPISLIKGNSTFHANENAKKQMLKNIRKILVKADSESFKLAEALWNNFDGQVLYGNSSAKFIYLLYKLLNG